MPVIASSAAASRRARSGAASPACRIVHAFRIASSTYRSAVDRRPTAGQGLKNVETCISSTPLDSVPRAQDNPVAGTLKHLGIGLGGIGKGKDGFGVDREGAQRAAFETKL